jgi:hypothetical protein
VIDGRGTGRVGGNPQPFSTRLEAINQMLGETLTGALRDQSTHPPAQRRPFPKLPLLVPLVLVNAAAVWGQAGWAHEHLQPRSWWLALGFATAIETIGVYLALEAHDALMHDQAAAMLRVGSYGVGVLAGGLNYWHFAGARFAPTATAVSFAVLSAISPWLWAIRSRAMNRARLVELGQIDKRGVKLSTSRKLWHPVKSLAVLSWASWAGVTEPDQAVRGWELSSRLAAGGKRRRELASRARVVQERPTVVAAVAVGEASPEQAPLAGDVDSDVVTEVAPEPVTEPATAPDTSPPPVRSTDRTARPDSNAAKVAKLRAKQPDITQAQVAKRTGLSARTVSRHWRATEPDTGHDSRPDTAPVNGAVVSPELVPATQEPGPATA